MLGEKLLRKRGGKKETGNEATKLLMYGRAAMRWNRGNRGGKGGRKTALWDEMDSALLYASLRGVPCFGHTACQLWTSTRSPGELLTSKPRERKKKMKKPIAGRVEGRAIRLI